MKKLSLVVPSLMKGGGVPSVARFVRDTALNSGKYDLNIISLCMSSREDTSLQITNPRTWIRGAAKKTGEWEGLPYTHVGANLGELEFQRYRKRNVLTDALRGSDIIQVVCGSPAWANAVVGLDIPVALQVATRAKVERRMRDANPKSVIHWFRKLMTEITDRLDAQALCSVDAIQVENQWMFEYAKKLNEYRQIDLRYAPPGVDGDIFHPLKTRDLAKCSYILCVGRLSDPRKNVTLLLHAYARLSHKLRDHVHLVLAGSSAPDVSFWKKVETMGFRDHIKFVEKPSLDELVSLYQNASVFVLPSDEEGLGVVILEAMACAVPVVSTKSGGPDGIILDGENGYLVPLNTPEKMADRISFLLENYSLNIEMGWKARKSIEKRYDKRIAGDVFVEMWDRLVF
ncbi:glycosyltransferase family 4 protein [Desulforhopalus vacuolatus]|uniref:glycosyltransferase family 4 protein n=1 Tax=Desulforhopalus vacuolatus TaxID=40414 RepID=UPI00196352CC|nr:glycosyltransferase family 4 protein [Desulforhopalus vacuolatus]MBM9520467.1 glycosyltransferase family 4 protein [Desulforhopalus vacuolatus]